MNRDKMLKDLSQVPLWDILIIGGGSVGLGVAVDAASRGYKTLLLEQGDFAQETSSRSTKLIHGGIRYLRQGYFSLVRESLKERALLLQNAKHLVRALPFVMPVKNLFESYYYYLGIKLYDFLSGHLGLKKSKRLSKQSMKEKFPDLHFKNIHSGIQYFDGQFDDSRLAINLAQTCAENGGTLLNYVQVKELLKADGKIQGVQALDKESGTSYNILSRTVINATGAFVDHLRKVDDISASPIVLPSQGSHIILSKEFFASDSAIILPETNDGRVLFIIPWNQHVLIGTTETSLDRVINNPQPLPHEIDFLLKHATPFLSKTPTQHDILGMFAGIRPLVKTDKSTDASKVSRDYSILISESNLISVVGGKWTTYRKIGEDVVNTAANLARLKNVPSKTQHLPIHGSSTTFNPNDEWSYYGSDKNAVEQLADHNPSLLEKMHPDLPCRPVDVIWSVRNEMARTVDDVLSRRTRCSLVGSKASLIITPQIASLIAQEKHQGA